MVMAMAMAMEMSNKVVVSEGEEDNDNINKARIVVMRSNKEGERSVFMMAQVSLRVLAIISSLVAICIIVTANQTITIFAFQITARYSQSSAFKYLVSSDAVVCAFSVVSLVCVYILRRSESCYSEAQLANKHFLLFLHDTVMLVLAGTGCAAGTAIGYVGRNGEPKMTWQAVCDQVSKFCNTMFVGSAFSYVAFFSYFVLTLVSARRLMISIPSATTPQ